jgi:Lhr-like helicase
MSSESLLMDGFGFHPVIADWFSGRYAAPTEPQEAGWPHIAAGEHTLIAAPTGSGKTLTAFLRSRHSWPSSTGCSRKRPPASCATGCG